MVVLFQFAKYLIRYTLQIKTISKLSPESGGSFLIFESELRNISKLH
jgi:hypothetical protein